MERCLQTDKKYQKVLFVFLIVYTATGIFLAVRGFINNSSYEILNSIGSLLVIPVFYLLRRAFKLKGGWQLETYIYIFTYLGWTLGGTWGFYSMIPYYDKAVHCLSGVFVSMLAMTLYEFLEHRHSKEGENHITEYLFVFAASMAVAGMFELCEFGLSPILGRDLQHVKDSGVTDTMMDMLVCLAGTVVFILLMIRSNHKKHDIFTDAAKSFVEANCND